MTRPELADHPSRWRRSMRFTGRVLVTQLPSGVVFGLLTWPFAAWDGDPPPSWTEGLAKGALFALVLTVAVAGPELWRARHLPPGVRIGPTQQATLQLERDAGLAGRIVRALESLPAEVTAADATRGRFVAAVPGRWGAGEQVDVVLEDGPGTQSTVRITSSPRRGVVGDGGRGYRHVTAVAERLRG